MRVARRQDVFACCHTNELTDCVAVLILPGQTRSVDKCLSVLDTIFDCTCSFLLIHQLDGFVMAEGVMWVHFSYTLHQRCVVYAFTKTFMAMGFSLICMYEKIVLTHTKIHLKIGICVVY